MARERIFAPAAGFDRVTVFVNGRSEPVIVTPEKPAKTQESRVANQLASVKALNEVKSTKKKGVKVETDETVESTTAASEDKDNG